MGQCYGKEFTPNGLQGQGNDVLKTSELLGFSKSELDQLYRYFLELDFNNSGFIDMTEFICMNGTYKAHSFY